MIGVSVVVLGDPAQPAHLTAAALQNLMGERLSVRAFEWSLDGAGSFADAAEQAERGYEFPVPDTWLDALGTAEVLVTHFFPIRQGVLALSPRLRVIATLRHGEENVDKDAARARAITVINNPGREAEAVSDFAVGLIIEQIRGLTKSSSALAAGEWLSPSDAAPYARNMRDVRVGIVGYGHVGRLVRKKIAGFGSSVSVCDPQVDDSTIASDGATPVKFLELLQWADVVTLHVRLSRSTHSLIGARELSAMQRHAYLINTARAELIDQEALLEALGSGTIAGAALDVFWTEPIPPGSSVMSARNLIKTPHLAGSTSDSQVESAKLLARRLADTLEMLATQ